MRRGCIITLVVTGILVILLFVVCIVVPLFMFDVVTSGPHIPTASFAGPDTVAILTILPAKSGIAGMVAESMEQPRNALDFYVPWECGAVLDLDPAGTTRTLTMTASPRHLGPLAMLFFGNPDVFPSTTIEVAGIESWRSRAVVNERGAMVLRGDGTLSPEIKAWADERWPEAVQATAPELKGGHFAELVVDNHGGRGFLALEGLLGIAPETLPPAPVAEADAGESTNGESALPAEMPEGGLDSEKTAEPLDWLHLVADIQSVRMTADFEEPDLYLVHLEADCPTAEAAGRVVSGLERTMNATTEFWSRREITIDSSIIEEQNRVLGEFSVTGVRPQVVDAIKQGSR